MSPSTAKLRVGLALFVSVLIGWGASSLFDVPTHPTYEASLLAQPTPVVAVLGVLAAFVIGTAASLPFVRSISAELPIACGAAAGLAFTWRGGSIYWTLTAGGPQGYVALAIETVLLFGAALLVWFALSRVTGDREEVIRVDPKTRARLDEEEESVDPEPLDQRVLALLTQAVVTAAVMMLLCRSVEKQQALGSVFVASFAGAWAAHRFIPASPAPWFWMGPCLVALVGYVSGRIAPAGVAIGDPSHYFGALARPLPLDYLVAGIPGAIYGYRTRRASLIEKAAAARAENASAKNSVPASQSPASL